MSVWARTRRPATIRVDYAESVAPADRGRAAGHSASANTMLVHDNTGVVTLENLKPDTLYSYSVSVDGGLAGPKGTFKTWPSADQTRNDKYNPEGLFNFRFEFACGNNQSRGINAARDHVRQPTFDTLLKDHADGLDFAILNGDWLYEDKRDFSFDDWKQQVGIDKAPQRLELIPSIAGIWENYKAYLERGTSLAEFHRRVPSFFTMDDHESLNDVAGSGQAGFKERRAVLRDPGAQAWLDYLAWSNPVDFPADIHFGRGTMKAGSGILTDTDANFAKLPFGNMSNLHVHWGGRRFGQKLRPADEYPGLPNAGVYDIADLVGPHQLRVSPLAETDATGVYSIGRRLYGQLQVSNCHFFMLDTRGHRDSPDFSNPRRPDRSMLGKDQLQWLQKGISESDAEFIFVVSSVNFMIPHSKPDSKPGDIPTKGEAWTVFMHERELLIDFLDELKKPVMLLTGDLHNSFAIQITDNVWEFASGPHESDNHHIGSEGHRPLNGPFKYGPRACDILWSSYLLPDTPKNLSRQPHFCVVQVNNVTNNPVSKDRDRWIAFPRPQIVIQYYHGVTGELKFAHSISAK
ncbi:MAG: alkaline phosphatase [Fuerstiella sp.]|nr:alkaline phosphatase [Fuerstiella sp.]MCP4784739.1 alkaline phosphatase [Fuerstiella sp.]MCP4856117.1 alkaline phosphatase [Fuerstiella sp.]